MTEKQNQSGELRKLCVVKAAQRSVPQYDTVMMPLEYAEKGTPPLPEALRLSNEILTFRGTSFKDYLKVDNLKYW